MANYIKGLPFTVDFRRMFEKTISSRSSDRNNDLKEITRFAINNAKKSIDVYENKRTLEVCLDAPGIKSQDDLVNMILGVYGQSTTESLVGFGAAIAAALATHPQEILFDTFVAGDPVRFRIDDTLVPTLESRVSRRPESTLKVVKYPSVTDNLMGLFKRRSKIPGDVAEAIKKKGSSRRIRKERVETFREMLRFAEQDVRINGDQYEFKLPWLFQKSYIYGDTVITFGVPSGSSLSRSYIMLKNNVAVYEKTNQNSSEKRHWISSTPSVLVSSPNLNVGINGTVIEDSKFKGLSKLVEKCTEDYYLDFMTSKVPAPKDWNEKRIFRDFLSAISSSTTVRIDYSALRMQAMKPEVERSLAFTVPWIQDTRGRSYTLVDLFKIVDESMKKNNSDFYWAEADGYRSHRFHSVIREIEKEHPVFLSSGDWEIERLDEILFGKRSFDYYDRGTNVFAQQSPRGRWNDVIARAESYNCQVARERKELAIKAATRTAIGAGVVVTSAAAIVAAPYVASGAYSLGHFLFLSHPEATLHISEAVAGAGLTAKYRKLIGKGLCTVGGAIGTGCCAVGGAIGSGVKYAVRPIGKGVRVAGSTSGRAVSRLSNSVSGSIYSASGAVSSYFSSLNLGRFFHSEKSDLEEVVSEDTDEEPKRSFLGNIRSYFASVKEKRRKKLEQKALAAIAHEPGLLSSGNTDFVAASSFGDSPLSRFNLNKQESQYLRHLLSGMISIPGEQAPVVSIYDTITLSPEDVWRDTDFRSETYKNGVNNLTIYVNSERFRERVKAYHDSHGNSVWLDFSEFCKLKSIHSPLNSHTLADHLSSAMSDYAVFSALQSADNVETFGTIFKKLGDNQKKQVVANICSRQSLSGIDDWLLENYDDLMAVEIPPRMNSYISPEDANEQIESIVSQMRDSVKYSQGEVCFRTKVEDPRYLFALAYPNILDVLNLADADTQRDLYKKLLHEFTGTVLFSRLLRKARMSFPEVAAEFVPNRYIV